MVSVWKIGNTAIRRLAGSEGRRLNAPEVGPAVRTCHGARRKHDGLRSQNPLHNAFMGEENHNMRLWILLKNPRWSKKNNWKHHQNRPDTLQKSPITDPRGFST
jgi:hypothetical protein